MSVSKFTGHASLAVLRAYRCDVPVSTALHVTDNQSAAVWILKTANVRYITSAFVRHKRVWRRHASRARSFV